MASSTAVPGVVLGRFQVLHNDHVAYLLAGKARCQHLVVGITNPDPRLDPPAVDPTDRLAQANNPLTYFERFQLVRAALREVGVAESEVSIVPLPIDVPEVMCHYAPAKATYYVTLYDDWGREKRRRLQELGLATEVLWERPIHQKGISSTQVRRLMVRGEPWEHLVPRAVARLLHDWAIVDRLREHADVHAGPP